MSPKAARIVIFGTIAITVIHAIYMNIMGFSSLSHDACFVYKSIPRWLFLVYENAFELFIVVVLGVFAGVMAEVYFARIERFYPKTQLLAFLYGSLLPVCACGVLPLIESLKKHTSLKVIITLVIAAPLLNPYIIFVSFSVLGVKYAVLRIISSFILAMASGVIVEQASKRIRTFQLGVYQNCSMDCAIENESDPFVKTMRMTRKLIPYMAIAAAFSILFQIVNPRTFLEQLHFAREPYTMIFMTLVGIPLYVCNGADVLFLKPLLAYTDLTMGSAMAFSLSASAICVASIIMLAKFLGKPLTAVLVVTVGVLTMAIGTAINFLPK